MNVDEHSISFADHARLMDNYIAKARIHDDSIFDELAAHSHQDLVTIAATALSLLGCFQSWFGTPTLIELVTKDDEAMSE